MVMSGVSVTYGIMAPWPTPRNRHPAALEAEGSRVMTGQRISERIAAVSPSATLAVDAKAKALKAAGRERDRLRCRRARLPHPRAHRRGGGRGACRDPRNHKYTPTAGLPELREAMVGQDRARLGLRGRRRPGPGDQRRQAGHRQRLRHPAATRATRCWCSAPYWTTYPEVIALAGGVPVVVATDDGQRIPGDRRAARGGAHAAHQGAALRLAVQPDRCGLPAGGDRGHRPLGARARPVGADRRDLRAPGLRRCRAPLDAGRWCPSWPTAAWWSTAWPRPTP